ncbi:MAG: DUF6465 family protein [Oscillospiraceae bacterium]|nr:DUF6465 family protein [Oscillospiraceae bacterium]
MAVAKKTDKVDEEVKKIKETTDKTISQVKNKKETAEKKVAEEVAEKIDEVKKAVTKKPSTAKKTAAKTKKPAAEKIVEEVKEVIEEKTAAVKKTAVKKTADVFIEYGGKQIKTADLIERAKADFAAAGNKKTDAKDVKVYVKPEESKAYYVINGNFTGNFEV